MTSPRLIITDALGRRQVPVDKPLLNLGRRSESDIRVSGVGVSRHHAEIVSENGTFRLRDCGSKFGTYINGERTIGERVLAHGDRIRLGETEDTEILFLLDDEDDDDEASRERSAVSAATELRHMAALLEGLRALGSGRVLDDVLTLVLDSAIETTGAERGFIMLANQEGRLEYKLGRAQGHVTLSGRTFATSRKIPENVFATGTQMIVEDLMDEGLAALHTGTVALGIRHVLCAPLRLVRYVERAEERSEEKMIGVLYLDSRERGALRSQATRAALETLSAEAAVAIENARLYREALERAKLDQELRVAAAIQRSLLPPAHRSGRFFSTAGTSVPCRSVGGDFFDYVDLSSGQFGFILGDVAGKGAPAALLAAAVIGMFGAEASYQSGAAPLVTRLNQGLFRRGIEARFLTAFYGMIGADGTLTYSNAGHNPPLLVSAHGVRRLETGGLVLGLFADAVWEQEDVALSPGDVIVAFSDGVSEALNEANEEYTDDRLIACVQAHRDHPPQALLDGVVADLRRFCGAATPNDDVTLVVVRYEGMT
ncbi:MAG: SpoIIE family protein phosphatase [Acidobacteria bacterium]|nr:SpoIIE family protein phosphatase [Acidobacteriota bacterium]